MGLGLAWGWGEPWDDSVYPSLCLSDTSGWAEITVVGSGERREVREKGGLSEE